MSKRTIVTFGTDGFRDFVVLPDGRTFNLGSVSVLSFVTELAMNGPIARRALDTFLKKKSGTLAVDMEKLQHLLKPRRARWAGLGNELMPEISRTSQTGNLMDQTTAKFASQLDAVEANLLRLEKQPDTDGKVAAELQASVREMLACSCAAPVAQPPAPVAQVAPETALEALAEAPIKLAAVDQDLKNEIAFYMDNEGSLLNKKKAVLTGLLRKMKAGSYDHNQAKKAWEGFVDAGVQSYAREFKEDPKGIPEQLKKALAKDIADSEKAAIENGEYDHLKTASEEPAAAAAPIPQEPAPSADLVNNLTTHKLGTEKVMDYTLAFKVKAELMPAEVQKAEGVAPAVAPNGTQPSYKVVNNPNDSALAFKATKKAEDPPAKEKVDDPYKGKDQSKDDTYYKLAAEEVPVINEALAQTLLTKVEQTLPVVQASTKKFASAAHEDLVRVSESLANLLKTADMKDPKVRLALLDLSKKTDHVLNYCR